ncbi:protein of unknown function [Burkholderia multivorans]
MNIKPPLAADSQLAESGKPRMGALNHPSVTPKVLSRWIVQLQARVGWYRTLVAVANKHARILALLTGRRVLSSYDLPGGERIWVITEADRSATTIVLPDDY